ncbi:MAG: hypothetical protein NTV01_20225 [Bacteroidia bacterium]|nr:hypothetical protein [Bacteroidia bacterium]
MISDKIQYLSRIALGFDFRQYLEQNQKRFIVFKINTVDSCYELMEGENFNSILDQSNKKYFHSKAGYLVDIKKMLDTEAEADLLLLSDVVLHSNPIDLDTIIIHELVHMIIDSNTPFPLELTEEAVGIGNEIYRLTDYHNELMTRHTVEFCQHLANVCIHYNTETKNFNNGMEAIRSAMRFDIFEI